MNVKSKQYSSLSSSSFNAPSLPSNLFRQTSSPEHAAWASSLTSGRENGSGAEEAEVGGARRGEIRS
jgi:hypothetical protein